MINIGSIVLGVGLLLAVMGVRFIMVSNSLKAGKPSDERLKTLYKEFLICTIAGLAIALIGIFSLSIGITVERAKIIGNVGGVLFGLGIPQFTQWKYGQGTEVQIKEGPKKVKKWSYFTLIVGVVLMFISSLISV